MKKHHPLTSQRKELVKFQFGFDTNETKLTLDPDDSINSLKEDWGQKLCMAYNWSKVCSLPTQFTFIPYLPACEYCIGDIC